MAKFLTLSHLKIFFKSLKEKLSPVAFSGNYEDIIDTPELADVATSGDYNDLKNKPKTSGLDRSDVENIMQEDLSSVAFSGNYQSLNNKPTIPEAGDYVTKGKKNGTTLGLCATAEGGNVISSANYSHAEGLLSKAISSEAHAEGWATQANGTASHAEGYSTQVVGQAAHAEGYRSISIGDDSHSEGQGTDTFTFVAKYSTGDDFIITTYPTAKEIKTNQLISIKKSLTTYYGYIYEYDSSTDTISVEFKPAPSSLAENDSFTFTVYESGAYGNYSHVEGNGNTAIGEGAHAEGHNNKAVGVYSHVEGQGARASGAYSHAEGETTAATGTHSHAEGSGSIASGQYSHAEGYNSKALAYASHSEGLGSTADGYYAHAEGDHTIAKHRAQHVFGKYNIEDPATSLPLEVGTYVEIVGNGENNARSNARTLDWNGNEVLAGTLKTSSSGITIGNTTITETQLQQLLALLNN